MKNSEKAFSQTIEVNINRDKSHCWYVMKVTLDLCDLTLQNPQPQSNFEKNANRGACHTPAHVKVVKATINKESLRNCHRQGAPQEDDH